MVGGIRGRHGGGEGRHGGHGGGRHGAAVNTLLTLFGGSYTLYVSLVQTMTNCNGYIGDDTSSMSYS